MLILLPILVAIIGLLMHYGAKNPLTQALGSPTYFAGLLVFLMQSGPALIGLLAKP